jgi:hypothetical protein
MSKFKSTLDEDNSQIDTKENIDKEVFNKYLSFFTKTPKKSYKTYKIYKCLNKILKDNLINNIINYSWTMAKRPSDDPSNPISNIKQEANNPHGFTK